MRKLRIILLEKLRDRNHKVRMKYVKKSETEAIRMGYYYRLGFPLNDKRIVLHRKRYSKFTKKSLDWANRVAKCNVKLIKLKAP